MRKVTQLSALTALSIFAAAKLPETCVDPAKRQRFEDTKAVVQLLEETRKDACEGKVNRGGVIYQDGHFKYQMLCADYFGGMLTTMNEFYDCMEERQCNGLDSVRKTEQCRRACGNLHPYNKGVAFNAEVACAQSAKAIKKLFEIEVESKKDESFMCRAKVTEIKLEYDVLFPGGAGSDNKIAIVTLEDGDRKFDFVIGKSREMMSRPPTWDMWFPLVFLRGVGKKETLMSKYRMYPNYPWENPVNDWETGNPRTPLLEKKFRDGRQAELFKNVSFY